MSATNCTIVAASPTNVKATTPVRHGLRGSRRDSASTPGTKNTMPARATRCAACQSRPGPYTPSDLAHRRTRP